MEEIYSLEDLNLNKHYGIKEEDRLISFLPNTFRCLVNGYSGSGKTNVVLQLLLKLFKTYMNIKPINLIICTPTIDQDLYKKFIEDISKKYNDYHSINLYEKIKELSPDFLKTLDNEKHKNIILIDDMIGNIDKKDLECLTHIFTATRPRKICVFFLTQSYTKLEYTCRKNYNYLITFKPTLGEAIQMCNEKIGNSNLKPNELINRFEDKPFFSLFCDIDKSQIYTVYDVFNINKEIYYKSLGEMLEKYLLLDNEIYAGNDSELIKDEMRNIIRYLENNEIIKKIK